jgi:hypothetical protein
MVNIVELAHFYYPTHCVYVYQYCDSGRIHCVKYDSHHIEWEYFEYQDWDDCKEYMITPIAHSIIVVK